MAIDWRPFVDLVGRHERFLITTHVRPDGDALGSEKALAGALRALGKHARIVNASPMGNRYEFMDPEREVETYVPPGDNLRDIQVLIVVDTGTFGQLDVMADFVRQSPAVKAVIDHHVTQDEIGRYRFVDTTAEAAGRLVYEAVRALQVPLTPTVATPLFVALATDTGWFRHGNVTPATFTLAHDLMTAGARPDYLYQQIFERVSIPRLRLMGQALSRLGLAGNGRIAHSAVLRADLDAAGASPQDAEDLTNFTVGLAGVQVSLLLTEQGNGSVKISLRSRFGVDVGKIAEQFGGGGHRQASGATLAGSIDQVRATLIAAIEAALPSGPG